jgi:DNA-binding CsgD family transcriptional regulator/N-acetylneuraminic acid mutarotase
MTDQPTTELSERELEILRLVATGAGNKEIAQKLVISPNTVKVHLRNIFAKIGVTSRTEAAMYAVGLGLVKTTESPQRVNADESDNAILMPEVNTTNSSMTKLPFLVRSIDDPASLIKKRKLLYNPNFMVIILVILGIVGVGGVLAARSGIFSPPSNLPTPDSVKRLQILPEMPTARENIGVTAYENKIYVIAGNTVNGVTGIVERFDPQSSTWVELSKKPVPVSEVCAGVVGGLIYVPGGKLASGKPTNIMEAYNPSQDRWEKRASLPTVISAYAMVVYEGRLYLFGGWDGQHYLNTVYEYDPSLDLWTLHSPMPTARAFAGAAVSQGKIYVLGGYDGKQILSIDEVYVPSQDKGSEGAWSKATSLPEPRYAMGAASLADLIFIFGGKGIGNQPLKFIQFRPQDGQWQQLEGSYPDKWSDMGLAALETQIYITGGELNGQVTKYSLSYQAIYTISIPLVP